MKINKLLVSQPNPAIIEKSPFYDIITKHKVAVDFVPFIKVEGVSSKEFRSQRVDVSAHTAVIFTSRATIDSFFRVCEECRVNISEDMKYFCVTEAIALYLQKYIVYRKRKIFFGKGSFADLMDIVVKHKEEKYLVALSDPHKPEIPKALDKAKIKHVNVILSRTVSNEVTNKVSDISNYDMLVFYSPAEIASLTSQFEGKINENTVIATFGVGTAQAAINAGLNVNVLAPTKECPSMVTAICKFIDKFNKGEEIDTTYISEMIKATAAQNELVMAKVKQMSKTKKSSTCKSASSKSSSTKSTSAKSCSKTTATKTPTSRCNTAKKTTTRTTKATKAIAE
ncbi:MAG: uroporphyrinogen-III synthase [Rikenellaceae bacterium]